MRDELLKVSADVEAKIAKQRRQLQKAAKWSARAAERGRDWGEMSKRERKVFRCAYRADRELAKLSRIIERRDAKKAPSDHESRTAGILVRDPGTGQLLKATTPSPGVADHHDMTEAEIHAANARRIQESL